MRGVDPLRQAEGGVLEVSRLRVVDDVPGEVVLELAAVSLEAGPLPQARARDRVGTTVVPPLVAVDQVLRRQQLASRVPRDDVPVIVVSADIQRSTAQQVSDAGAFRFLGKPAETSQIIQAVNAALGATR